MWQQRAGVGYSPRTVLQELARIESHDVVLPTPPHGDIRVRSRHPDGVQAALADGSTTSCPSACVSADPYRPALALGT